MKNVDSLNKVRKSFFALSDLGSPFINPRTLTQLYKTIMLPSVLYGYTLWNNLSFRDRNQLNKVQYFICKNSLNLPKLSRSDMCEPYFAVHVLPICAEIDVRKLLFLGWLCRINPKMLTKNIFLTRIFYYFHDLSTNQLEFIPDITNILQNYYRNDHLCTFLDDGFFSWKTFLEKNCTLQSTSHVS